MAATMRRYLDQLAVSLRASSVTCIETTLRQVAGHLITTSQVVTVAGITRVHIEAYKTWLAGRGGYRKKHPDLENNHRHENVPPRRVLPADHRVGIPRRPRPATGLRLRRADQGQTARSSGWLA